MIRQLFSWSMLILLCCPLTALAQEKEMPVSVDTLRFYWVEFSDKKDSPFSVKSPEVFLSEKAIKRRKKYHIPITEDDFPPNPEYLSALRQKGAKVMHASRWLNAATITIPQDSLEPLEQLPFINFTKYVGVQIRSGARFSRTVNMDSLQTKPVKNKYYGYGQAQIEMINGQELHDEKYTGSGVTVAVLDGGFTGVDVSPFFEHLRKKGRLLPGYDFVDLDTTVYESSSHGTRVLSTMAAKVPKLLVGTAPDATYICIKTEDVSSENPLEECKR